MSNTDLELGDMIDLLGLELTGVKVVVKELGTMNRKRAGEYSFFSCQIALRREIIPYWFATLATLLHEYGHHRQRWVFRGLLILIILSALVPLIYMWAAPSLLSSIPITILGLVAALLKPLYFEAGAERYARDRVPCIFISLSDLEFVEIVEKLQGGKGSPRHALAELYESMRKYNPQLLG